MEKKPVKKLLSIAYDDLQALVEEGKGITTTPKAEKALLKLLDLKDEIDRAIKEAGRVIEEKALEINPNFASIRSDSIVVLYREYGNKYGIDESRINEIPKDFYKIKVSYSPESKSIEKFAKENGNLPDGIKTLDRKKSLSITRAKKDHYDIEN